MIAVKRILVPTDFSETSDAALRFGIGLCQAFNARLYLLHVPGEAGVNFEADFPTVTFENALGEHLDTLVSPDEAKRLHPEYALRLGVPADEIVRYAFQRDIDLIVMGTHGRSGFDRLMLGSTTETLLHKAPCPVLTVPAHTPDASSVSAPFTRVLCAVDFSPGSLRALALAESLAGEAAANLNVIHVLEPASVFEPVAVAPDGLPVSGELQRAARHRLQELVKPDTRAFADVDETVSAGKPYQEILRAATEQGSDLIVLGVAGHHLAGFGSTTTHVVREAECPVLTVRG